MVILVYLYIICVFIFFLMEELSIVVIYYLFINFKVFSFLFFLENVY